MIISRIQRKFDECRAANRAALVLYLTFGFPDAAATAALLPVLEASGCDILELGIPFSDPIADGPSIQEASRVALERGATLAGALASLREFRRRSELPVVLFGAANPFHRGGFGPTARRGGEAGADAILCPDLPLEESGEVRAACDAAGLHHILLAAPTADDDRLARIAAASSGFLYCIAFRGITGGSGASPEDTRRFLARARATSPLPVALGFGLKTPADVRAVAPHCDAAVVGTALVDMVSRTAGDTARMQREVAAFVRSLAEAVRR